MQFSLRLLLLRRIDRLTNYLVSSITQRSAWRPVAPDGPVGGRPAGQRLEQLGRLNDATAWVLRRRRRRSLFMQQQQLKYAQMTATDKLNE